MILVFSVSSSDLINLPSWARWIAQDADGVWWAYEVEPLQFHKGCYENEVGRIQRVCKEDEPKNWRETCRRVDNTNNKGSTPP